MDRFLKFYNLKDYDLPAFFEPKSDEQALEDVDRIIKEHEKEQELLDEINWRVQDFRMGL